MGLEASGIYINVDFPFPKAAKIAGLRTYRARKLKEGNEEKRNYRSENCA
jgi:hypothetical protein